MQLKHELGGKQYFSLSFGTIVGVGWVIVLGNWLDVAGPAGAVLAFVAGGLLTALVGACYAELGTWLPVSGGEVAYAYEIYGVKACFATGWFLAFAYIATTIFEALSLGRIAGTLLPGIEGSTLYFIRGDPVQVGTLLLAILGMTSITALNYIGVKTASKFQDAFTYTKIALAAAFIAAGLFWGKVSNLQPIFPEGDVHSRWNGFLAVFLTTPFWLSGFQVVSQVIGERAPWTRARTVGRIILLSIASATLFYCLVILACSMTMPWQLLPKLTLPAATVFEIAFHRPLFSKLVLLVALLGNLTVWNGISMAASRVLFALGRAHIIPKSLGKIHPLFGVPHKAVLFVGVLASCGVFLGRGAILPVVNVASTCYAFAFILVCFGALKIRNRRQEAGLPKALHTVIGWLAALVSLATVIFSLYQPYVNSNGFPLEWALFLGWSGLGVTFWFGAQKIRASLSESERRSTILYIERAVE